VNSPYCDTALSHSLFAGNDEALYAYDPSYARRCSRRIFE
jgi:CDGSH-type Zn-finger protein